MRAGKCFRKLLGNIGEKIKGIFGIIYVILKYIISMKLYLFFTHRDITVF